MPAPREISERLWARVERGADGCWRWTGAQVRGYGQIKSGRRLVYTHRLAYELLVGPIPQGLPLDHLCRVRSCCNPEHLQPVPQRENVERGVRDRQTCQRGHRWDDGDVYVDRSGQRQCRVCRREADRRWRARRSS